MHTTWRVVGTMIAMAVLALPATAQGGRGQGPVDRPGPMSGAPGAMARNPAAAVLEHRDALDLTEEQVDRLEGIRDRIDAEHEPLRDQMKAALGDTRPRDLSAAERRELRTKMHDLAPVRSEIRAINRAAREDIHALLTDGQLSRLRPLMRSNRGRDGDRPARDRRPRRGPRGDG